MGNEPLYCVTGNPWVDGGIHAMAAMAEVDSPELLNPEHLEKISHQLIRLYQAPEWRKALYSFFPNRPGLTHPRLADIEYFAQSLAVLQQQIQPLGQMGSCIACGRRNVNEDGQAYYRDYIPLTGAGGMRNFFPAAKEGTDYCAACVYAVQFCPIICVAGAKLLLPYSASNWLMKYWAESCWVGVNGQIGGGVYTGPSAPNGERWLNPRNALFRLASFISNPLRIKDMPDTTVRLFEFTNYNQGPELKVYDLAAEVFNFVARMAGNYSQAWKALVQNGYRGKSDKTAEENYNALNLVYNNLLAGRGINGLFFRFRQRAVICEFALFEMYLQEVRGMADDRIELLKSVADDVVLYIKKRQDKAVIGRLERSKSLGEMRGALLEVQRKWVSDNRFEKAFVEFDQVISIVGPRVGDWRTLRDLMLFRIYEQLQDMLKDTLPEYEDSVYQEEV